MTICPITGTAAIQLRDRLSGLDDLVWVKADPEIHVAIELLEDLVTQAHIIGKYEIGEICPYQPYARHARLKAE